MRLGIDPGHGGSNVGTTAGGIVEKDVNMHLAIELFHALPWDRVECEWLRYGDETVSLADRGLRSVQCDWVLSIHVNAGQSHQTGAEVYVPGGDNLAERLVGNRILDAMPPELRTRRIIEAVDPDPASPGNWLERPEAVLKHHKCRKLLVEAGYASNASDRYVIQSDWGRMAIVSAMRAGVATMLRDWAEPR